MAISYNTGTTAAATAVAHTFQPTITVPSGVLTGDLMLVSISVFSWTGTTPGFTLTASSGHTWAAVGGGFKDSGANGGFDLYSAVWSRTATAGDASDTLTLAYTGGPGSTDQWWWDVSIDAWTGAGAVDVVVSSVHATTQTLPANPTTTTGAANDWAVQICCAAINGSGSISGAPSGTTQRGLFASNSGVGLSVVDSNASVGAAGSTIGGGTFTLSSQDINDVLWTIGISPSGSTAQAPLLPFQPGQTWRRQFQHPQTPPVQFTAGPTISLPMPQALPGQTWRRQFKHPQLLLAPPISTAQNLTQTLATSVTAVGALKIQVGKILAGSVTAVGALKVQVGKILAGSVTASGGLIRQVGTHLTGAVTAAPGLIRQVGKILPGGVTAVGSLTTSRVTKVTLAGFATVSGVLKVQVRPILLGSVTASGSQILRIGKILAGSVTASGALVRLISIAEKGFVTAVGTMTAIKTKLLTLAGNVTASGALLRQVRPILAGSVTAAPAVVRAISTHLTGSVTAVGGLVRRIGKILTGSATAVGGLSNRMARGVILATTVNAVGGMGRAIRIGLKGAVTALGNLILTPSIHGAPLPEDLNALVTVYSPAAVLSVRGINAGVVIYIINANVDS